MYFTYDSGKQLANTMGMVLEQFIEQEYKWLNVKHKDVIDIGANIGDSAIYFALNGAKHIYAFELYPYSYNLAIKNINLNELNNKISLFNQGVGTKKSSIMIKRNFKNYGGTDLKAFDKGDIINITTLEEIVNKFKINNAALKIDCEGCEYNIILNASDDTLMKFNQIIIEYHYGYLNLKSKLEKSGFIVKNTFPRYSFNTESENHDMIIGFLYATLPL